MKFKKGNHLVYTMNGENPKYGLVTNISNRYYHIDWGDGNNKTWSTIKFIDEECVLSIKTIRDEKLKQLLG